MFRIREAQMQSLEAASVADFEASAVEELREALPEETERRLDEELLECLRQSLARADRYGLTTEFEVFCFAQAMILLGEDFEGNPKRLPAQMVLRSPTLAGEEKATLLVLVAAALTADND